MYIKYEHLGPISENTLDIKYLINVFKDFISNKRLLKLICANFNERDYEELLYDMEDTLAWYQEGDNDTETLDELTDILSYLAPPGVYFGSHPGNSSDIGYWMTEELIQLIEELNDRKFPFKSNDIYGQLNELVKIIDYISSENPLNDGVFDGDITDISADMITFGYDMCNVLVDNLVDNSGMSPEEALHIIEQNYFQYPLDNYIDVLIERKKLCQ